MDDDLNYLSNLLSADIDSDSETPNQLVESNDQIEHEDGNNQPTPGTSNDLTKGKRKYTEDDGFMKDLENDINAKRKKLQEKLKQKNENIVKTVFDDLSDDEEDDEYNVFNTKSDKDNSNMYSLSLSNNKTTWKSKVDQTKSNLTNVAVGKNEKLDVYAEPIFGMRIINPCLSIQELKYKMTGRQAIPMSKIKEHVNSPNANTIDWVAGGVIVGKSHPKTSSKGSQYCIWSICDLKPSLKSISLFLFGNAFTSLWKTNLGTVIGILNPSVMENSKPNEEACLSVNNGDKIMCWGTSKDYGLCKARKKDGENCTNFVNTRDCQFCVYHVKQEYKKFTGRSEFQSQGGGALTNLRNKVLGKNEVFYAGQSFSSLKPAKKSTKLIARDNKLLQSLSKSGIVVSALSNNIPIKSSSSPFNQNSRGKLIEDAERMRRLSGKPVHVGAKLPGEEANTNTMTFKNIFNQKSNELNLDKSKTMKNFSSLNNFNSPNSNHKSSTLSNSTNKSLSSNTISKNSPIQKNNNKISTRVSQCSNLSKSLLNAKQMLIENCSNEKSKALLKSKQINDSNIDDDIFDFGNNEQLNILMSSPNINNTNSHSKTFNNEKNLNKPQKVTENVSEKMKINENLGKNKTNLELKSIESTSKSLSYQNSNLISPKQNGVSEYFAKKNSSIVSPQENNSKRIVLSKDLRERKKQITRAKAENLIKFKGGIEKQNPNSLKKNISKVINKSMELEIEIENADKNDKLAEFKAMMNKTSAHMDLVDEVHRREEEEYFEKLEKKEQMEEKMMTTFKVECKAVRCIECKYTWFSASDLCKKKRHTIKLINTFKRFFKCCNCNNRTISFDVVPLRPCRHCGVTNWSRAPMMQERKVNLDSHLSIRGDETKYLSSMNSMGEASLNLLVPE